MSFQALARTWRPRRFDELVGQSHVVRALTHALEQEKLHHALLFSGTRGVGKTTLARIIAKCLNCEHGVSAHPCRADDACATCREIDEGRFVDLIEVDAASRTGVDDTRELMDNVQYAPTRGRTKVYLIDEVHMLSKHSFNALLKTLEEPPPRVQFLLATTEPEKIPVTILSRCLQFPLKRLPVGEIGQQLRHIVDAESIAAEDDALQEVARAADGSMRDGLSLLDQAVAFSGGTLEADAVRDMLGTIGQARVAELVESIVDARATDALDALAALYAQGIDMRYLLEALATAWQTIATIHVVGEAIDEDGAVWQPVAARAEPGAVHVFYDIAVAGVRDLTYAPDPLVGVRMSVLRMLAFAPAEAAARPAADAEPSGGASPAPAADPAQSGVAQLREQLGSEARAARSADSRDVTTARPAPQPVNGTPASAADTASPVSPNGADHATQPDGADRTLTVDEHGPAQSHASAPREGPGAVDAAGSSPSVTEDDGGMPVDTGVSGGRDAPDAEPADRWHALVAGLDVNGFAAQLAHNGVCRRMDDERIVLVIARANEFIATAGACEALQNAIGRAWSSSAAPTLVIEYVDEARDTPAQRIEENAQARQQEAVDAIENDPYVQQLRERLGAQLRAESIKPNRPSDANHQRDEL